MVHGRETTIVTASIAAMSPTRNWLGPLSSAERNFRIGTEMYEFIALHAWSARFVRDINQSADAILF